MEANGGLYFELVDRAERMGNENENMEIIDRGNFTIHVDRFLK